MWRPAHSADDDALIDLCVRLYQEDPGVAPVAAANMRATLAAVRHDPGRGRALVLDLEGKACGYALLITFWSNEFGGEACEVSELYVVPECRKQGHATSLFTAMAERAWWLIPPVAIVLGVTPDNARAQHLYRSLGFAPVGILMVRPQ